MQGEVSIYSIIESAISVEAEAEVEIQAGLQPQNAPS